MAKFDGYTVEALAGSIGGVIGNTMGPEYLREA